MASALELGGKGQQGFRPDLAVLTGREVMGQKGPVLFTFRSSEPLGQPGACQVLPNPMASFSPSPRPLSCDKNTCSGRSTGFSLSCGLEHQLLGEALSLSPVSPRA